MKDVTFTRKERQENMKRVLEALPKDMNFNTLMFTFADVIQSSFLNGLLIGKSPEERKVIEEEIVDVNNRLIDALKEGDQNLMTDMVVLSNLIMDAVNNAQSKMLEDFKEPQETK